MLKATLTVIVWSLLAAAPWPTARANTEIVNFDAREGHGISLPQDFEGPVLHPAEAEKLWKLLPGPLGTSIEDVCEAATYVVNSCPHELWVVLDLDGGEWRRYSKLTLRVSWPASSPADFLIQTYSPDALDKILSKGNASGVPIASSLSSMTRPQFARIRLVDTGVRTPSSEAMTSPELALPGPVPFIMLLEPLYFGVLPASIAPILLFLVPILSFTAVIVVPFINRSEVEIALTVIVYSADCRCK